MKPPDLESWRGRFERDIPFPRHLGVRLEDLGEGRAVVSLEIRPEHLQAYGFLHGGVTATLADVAVACAVLPSLAEDEATFTADLHVRYFEAVREGPVRAEARILRRGRGLVVAEADVTDGAGRLAARADAAYVVRPRRAEPEVRRGGRA